MDPAELVVLAGGVFVVALLYSSVGHAGASGYIAVMSLLELAPREIKPTALALNVIVACVGTLQFWRAGHFSWSLFWPFAALAAPMAFLGGYVDLPARAFEALVGLVLLFSAARFFLDPAEDPEARPPSRATALSWGAGLGFLAGLTGTGGGIFLTPLLLFMRWARAKPAASASALFILLNSSFGLLGNLGSARHLPSFTPVLAVAAVAGGVVGSHLGSRRFEPRTIKRLLAAVLTIAGAKLILAR